MRPESEWQPSSSAPARTDGRQVFVCYRRSDSQAWAGRLADDLREYLGDTRVYRDIDSNRPAANYRRLVDEALAGSRVVIVVIGPSWLVKGRDGQTRLSAADDLVRIEIERALTAGIAVVPVFVGGGTMPSSTELPESLEAFSRIHGQRLSDEEWSFDLNRLIETLDKHGVLPDVVERTDGEGEPVPDKIKRATVKAVRYERTFRATRRRGYDAAVGAVELLRYHHLEERREAAQVRFAVFKRQVTVNVVDERPGQCTVRVEFGVLTWKAMMALAFVPPFYAANMLGGVALRALERRFAIGFLDNVQRVLDGKGIGPDSALPPGLEKWREQSRVRKV
jgi:TIR domain